MILPHAYSPFFLSKWISPFLNQVLLSGIVRIFVILVHVLVPGGPFAGALKNSFPVFTFFVFYDILFLKRMALEIGPAPRKGR